MAQGGRNFGENQANVQDYVSKTFDAGFQHVRGRVAFHQGIFENLGGSHDDRVNNTIDYLTEFVGSAVLLRNEVRVPGPNDPNPDTRYLFQHTVGGYYAAFELRNLPPLFYQPDFDVGDIGRYIRVLVSTSLGVYVNGLNQIDQYSPSWITPAVSYRVTTNEEGILDQVELIFTANYVEPQLQPQWIQPPPPDFVIISYRIIRSEYETPDTADPTPPPTTTTTYTPLTYPKGMKFLKKK